MNRWPCIGAGLSLVVGACVKVPEFKGGDAATTSDTPACTPDLTSNGPLQIALTAGGGGATVMAPNYFMHFANDPGFHFPDDVRINNIDVMSPIGNGCGGEDVAGMALFPAQAIRSNGSATVGANQLIRHEGWQGPAVIKLTTHWSTSYSCGATPGGDTTFTLFPDGRVMRHDYMFNNAPQDWSACDCTMSGTMSFYPTSYWTFMRGMFSTYQLGTQGSPTDVATFTGTTTNQPVVCLQGGGAVSVTQGWRLIPGTTTSRFFPISTDRLALVYDFYVNHSQPSVGNLDYTASSVTILGQGCATGVLRADEFARRTAGALYINDVSFVPADVDGIFGGAQDRSGVGGVPLTKMSAELHGDVPAFFAVWLRFPDPHCDITITKDPDPGAGFYTKQKIDDDEWVVVFRDSLTEPHKITITAQ